MACEYLDLISNGKTYALFGDKGMDVSCTSVTGFGHPEITNVSETGPRQDGSTFQLYKVNDRIIQLGFTSIAKTNKKHYENRNKILNMFRVNNGSMKLCATFPYGKRYLDVRFNSGIANDLDRMSDGLSQKFVVELFAPDPIWYNPTLKTMSYTYTHVYNHLIFPFEFGTATNDMAFTRGYVNVATAITIPYLGNWMSYPVIDITGPINAPIVTNVTLGKYIALNYNVGIGEVVTINTGFGVKSVTSDIYPDEIISITDRSDMTGFRIEVTPVVTTNNNVISFNGNYAKSGVTKIDVKYYDRYIGV